MSHERVANKHLAYSQGASPVHIGSHLAWYFVGSQVQTQILLRPWVRKNWFKSLAVGTPNQTLKILTLNPIFQVLFLCFVVFMPVLNLSFRPKGASKDLYGVRVVVIVSHFLALLRKLQLVSLHIQRRRFVPEFLPDTLLLHGNLRHECSSPHIGVYAVHGKILALRYFKLKAIISIYFQMA
jgi:hypothetical protein